MTKKSKKRTKRYHGEDAKITNVVSQPVIHRFEAVERSATQEWWMRNRKFIKILAYLSGGILLVIWLLFELVQIIF